MVKKTLTWAMIIFLVFFVVSRPDMAGNAVKAIGTGLLSIGSGFGGFFHGLVS